MQKTAQDSQSKSDSPRRPRIYAIAKKSADIAHVHVAFWTDGGPKNFMVGFSRREIAAEIAEIENTLADGPETFDPGNGQIYEISPELLGELRSILSSYHAVLQGGSDANVVRKGVSTPLKSKASAPQGNAPAARQFNEERRTKNEERDRRIAQAIAVRAERFNGSGAAAEELAGEVARIVGEELRRAVMPVLAEIDAITALVKECASELEAISKNFITCASGKIGGRNTPPAPRRKGGRDSYCPKAGRVNAEGSISTRRGRTSVVVGRRKVS